MLHDLFQSLLDLLLVYWPAVLGLVALVLGALYLKVQDAILDWIDDLLE